MSISEKKKVEMDGDGSATTSDSSSLSDDDEHTPPPPAAPPTPKRSSDTEAVSSEPKKQRVRSKATDFTQEDYDKAAAYVKRNRPRVLSLDGKLDIVIAQAAVRLEFA